MKQAIWSKPAVNGAYHGSDPGACYRSMKRSIDTFDIQFFEKGRAKYLVYTKGHRKGGDFLGLSPLQEPPFRATFPLS